MSNSPPKIHQKAKCVANVITLELFVDSSCVFHSPLMSTLDITGCFNHMDNTFFEGLCDQSCAGVNAMGSYVVKPVSWTAGGGS